jgi:hypothetical protein
VHFASESQGIDTMTTYGRLNLLGIIGMPLIAVVAEAWQRAMEDPYAMSFVAIFLLNLVPMLVGGAVTGLLLRSARKAGGGGTAIALAPSVGTAVIGSVWYLWRAFVPDPVAPGVEIIAAPQYLLPLAILLSVGSWIGCLIARSRR